MKAVLCTDWGLPETLTIQAIADLQPGDGEVVVEVHAAGVNFPDALIIQRKYQFQPDLPFSPGGEVAGIIRAIGPNVSDWKIGDRVIGSSTWGGFAEQAIIKAERLVPIPDEMDFTAASAFVLAHGTSLHGLKDRAQLVAGETLLVLGAAGGVGVAAIEIGKAMGARVIAAASSEDKLEFCRQHGADATINYSTEDLRDRLKALTDGVGPDVIYDPIGGSYSETAFRAIAWGGRHLVVGFASGDVPKLPLNLPLLKSASVVGVFLGSFLRRGPSVVKEHMRHLMEMYTTGVIKPSITKVYSLEEAHLALRDVMERRVMGKVVLVPR